MASKATVLPLDDPRKTFLNITQSSKLVKEKIEKKYMKKFDVITIGGATEDISLLIDDYKIINNHKNLLAKKLLSIEYGAKTIAHHSFTSYGGGAANLAIAISHRGLRPAIITAIGQDQRGQNILKNLQINKIKTDLIKIISQEQSALSLILIGQDGEHTIISHRGANDFLDLHQLKIKNQPSPWLYISSLSGKTWSKNLNNIFNSGKKIVWNPGQLQLLAGSIKLKKFLQKTEILIINQDEALQLLSDQKNEKKILKSYNQDIAKLIQKVWQAGPKMVIITADKQGAWAYNGQQLIHQPAYPVKKVIDTTGVGDAFGGTLVAEFIKTNNLKKSLKIAAKQAAAILSKPGAQSS